MGKTTGEITSEIEQARVDLMSNLQELEGRVKEAADWRTHVRKRPGAMFVAAVLGGALLSTLVAKAGPRS